jgi:hypothetical protein
MGVSDHMHCTSTGLGFGGGDLKSSTDRNGELLDIFTLSADRLGQGCGAGCGAGNKNGKGKG